MAMALFFSAFNVFFRDFQNIVGTIMQFMHFLVPMMYPFTLVWAAHESHPWLYKIYVANPIAQAVLLLQRFFWYPLIEDTDGIGQQFPPDMWHARADHPRAVLACCCGWPRGSSRVSRASSRSVC